MVTLVQPTPDEGPQAASFKKMLGDVIAREKIIKDKWLDKTKDTYDIYEGARADETPFNILYSNTEILVPNLFSSTPRPIVRKRFGEMRADGASQAAERMAEYCLDTNLSGYPDFVEAVEGAVLDSALPGQGQCRVRVVDGNVCLDYVQHDRFIWAYAQRWEDTPWVAYRLDKTVEDIVREFSVPPEVAARINKPVGDSRRPRTAAQPHSRSTKSGTSSTAQSISSATPSPTPSSSKPRTRSASQASSPRPSRSASCPLLARLCHARSMGCISARPRNSTPSRSASSALLKQSRFADSTTAVCPK